MKRNILTCIFLTTLLFTSCGLQNQKEQAVVASPASQLDVTTSPVDAVMPTPPSKTAKKTVKEALGVLMDENVRIEKQRAYFSGEYDDVRFDDISEWKDEQGNYQYPKGYTNEGHDDASLASQQMPQDLLDEISTEELYQLILSLPGDWGHYYYDTYLGMLGAYYMRYNFIENLMEREDAAGVVHQYYQKYTKKEIKKYSKRYNNNNGDSVSERQKEGRFQLTEGLEWFFLYKEGKKVPNYTKLGYHIVTEQYRDADGNLKYR